MASAFPCPDKVSPKSVSKEDPLTITIWVHGTKRLPRIAPLPFVRYFFDCESGLHLGITLDKAYHHRVIVDTLHEADPVRFPQDQFYLFGWSGLLSVAAREEAASDLYDQLNTLIEGLRNIYGYPPRVRIITHSHGGNVVLNMAKIKDRESLVIDELILLACPVQKKTAHLIKEAMFKKIYSFYSIVDMIQVADPQGLYHHENACPLFSGRRFDDQDNLQQQEVRFKGRPIMHVEFMLPHFLKMLPGLLDSIENS